MQPLRDILKQRVLPKGKILKKTVEEIWGKVLCSRCSLCHGSDAEEFHLMVHWSLHGCNYALFTDHYEKGKLVGVNSKGKQK